MIEKVYVTYVGKTDADFDHAIREFMSEHGLTELSSGYCMGERDLCFIPKQLNLSETEATDD